MQMERRILREWSSQEGRQEGTKIVDDDPRVAALPLAEAASSLYH
jgi:hypothetical protein